MQNLEMAMHNLETAIDNLETAKHNSIAQPFSSSNPAPRYTHSRTQTTPRPPEKTSPTSLSEKLKQLNATLDKYDKYAPVLEFVLGVVAFGTTALVVVGSGLGLVWIVLHLLCQGAL